LGRLALIDAEQQVWRETMMTTQPDDGMYLSTRAALTVV
jgi:hypothetical protein